MLELDAGCQLRYDLKEGMKFLQRLSLTVMTEPSGSQQIIMQDQSLQEQCSEMLKRIRGYLEFCYHVKTTDIAEWCVGDEILVFREKLLKSEIDLADLSLALIGKKASVKYSSDHVQASNVGLLVCDISYLGSNKEVVLSAEIYRAFFPVSREGVKTMIWEIPPAGWLILQLPTAQAGPHNSHGRT